MQFIAPGEHKKFLALAAVMVTICHVRREQMAKRWLPAGRAPSWQDHPAVAYLLENGIVWTAAYLVQTRIATPDKGNPAGELWRNVLRSLILVDSLIAVQKLLIAKLWPHVPYFSQRKPPEDWPTMLKEYFSTNFIDNTIGGLILLASQPSIKGKAPGPIHLAPFLAKYLLGRVIVDVTFGVVHYAMHAYPTFYNSVHKRHHEHTAPRSQTNFHFELLDLILEAGAPVFTQIFAFRGLGINMSHHEQAVLTCAFVWFESASHAGKEFPSVTWFPLLSPLVGWITGMDDRLVEYHTRHHQLYNCNYSISPWPDKLCGTYRIDLPEAYASAIPKDEPASD